MNIRNMLVMQTLLVALLSIAPRAFADQPGAMGPDPKTLSVLYAGRLDSERMRQTKAFLEKHFAKVEVCDLESKFAVSLSKCDIVVVDWELGPRGLTLKQLADLDATQKFYYRMTILRSRFVYPHDAFSNWTSKPVVVMGMAGLTIPILKKVDSEVPHMGDYALDTNMEHPIFKGPLPVDVQWETIEQPINYFLHSGSTKIGERIQGWRVQTRTELDPLFGFCCDQGYLTDTHNAELISCGTADAPGSATIFRYGNCLVWGFASTPESMTLAGQAAFVNSICYMKAFSRQSAGPVRKAVDIRRKFINSLYFFRSTSYEYTVANQKYMTEFGASALDSYDYATPLQDPAKDAKKIQQSQQDKIYSAIKSLPRDVRDQFSDDPQSIIDYYEKNIEYLHLDGRNRYVVDEEVQELGISNRSPEFLKRCIDLLSDTKHAAVACELLERYTEQPSKTAQQWRAWYEETGKEWSFDEMQSKFVAYNVTAK